MNQTSLFAEFKEAETILLVLVTDLQLRIYIGYQ